jgi:hypothetical protein
MLKIDGRTIAGSVSALALFIVTAAFATPAVAVVSRPSPVDAVAAASPRSLLGAGPATTKTGASAVIDTTVNSAVITIPLHASSGITMASRQATLKIGLPNAAHASAAVPAQAGVVSYNNNDGSSTVPVVEPDGSVRISTVTETRSFRSLITTSRAPPTRWWPIRPGRGRARITVFVSVTARPTLLHRPAESLGCASRSGTRMREY